MNESKKGKDDATTQCNTALKVGPQPKQWDHFLLSNIITTKQSSQAYT